MEHKVAGSGDIAHFICQLLPQFASVSLGHVRSLFESLLQLDRQAAREQEELAESEALPPAGALSFSRVSGLQR